MYREFYAASEHLGWPMFAFALFAVFFAAIVIRTYGRRGGAAAYEELARMPLSDETRRSAGGRHGSD